MRAERAEVRRVAAAEPVDRLVGVADRAEIVAVAEPATQHAQLRRADVLKLVDEEMAEPPALRCGEGLVVLERVAAQRQQVVEVEQPAPPLLPLVPGVDGGDLRRRTGWCAAGEAHRRLVAVGLDQAGLRPLDLAGELRRHDPCLGAAGRDQGHEQAGLALEEDRGGAAPLGRLAR